MDTITNTNHTNPFMQSGIMYNGNFVDMMLKYIMEHGWSGLTLITFFNFYVYLSLDKFKELFEQSYIYKTGELYEQDER